MGDLIDPSARVEPNHRGCQVAGPTMQLKLQPDFLPYAANKQRGGRKPLEMVLVCDESSVRSALKK